MLFTAMLVAAATAAPQPPPLPTVTLECDDTEIAESCRIVIPAGKVIVDANGDGVIHVMKPGITIEFAEGSVLRGSKDVPPDTCAGTAIRIAGHKGVTIRNATVEGFKCGLWATDCPGLTVESCRFRDLWRQHLKSTTKAEDGADWLWPHNNDDHQWRVNYGAAIALESCEGATVRGCTARAGQNGLLLDRTDKAAVYDNDFSFLSGWGVALWRANGNTIAHNAVDFCIRGYSHGVYNRGQDSAGILVFEQCSKNTIAENSVTHGGDGLFGFAGRESLGEAKPPTADFDYTRRGCNDNIIAANDLSYAAAHGIEMTFSFGNRFSGNRLVGNAICGVWGGYSQDSIIDNNEIAGNGLPGAGEGGGIGIEHGYRNIVAMNRFEKNTVGVAYWANPGAALANTPWGKANHKGSDQNRIERSTFKGDTVAIRLRNSPLTGETMNTFEDVPTEIDADDKSKHQPFHLRADEILPLAPVLAALPGTRRPVGARKPLEGRQNIIMTEWGPWDHETTLTRLVEDRGPVHTYALYKLPDGDLELGADAEPGAGVEVRAGLSPAEGDGADGRMLEARVLSEEPGVHPYTFTVAIGPYKQSLQGTLVNTLWTVRFFPTPFDPRKDEAAWKKAAEAEGVTECHASVLSLKFGMGGPSDLKGALDENLADTHLPRDHFGTLAKAVVPLPPGNWRIKTNSDDGIRVRVRTGGLGQDEQVKTVIDDWTWHGPKHVDGAFTLPLGGPPAAKPPGDEPATPSLIPVEITVEHFELDGYAILEVELEPVPAEPPARQP